MPALDTRRPGALLALLTLAAAPAAAQQYTATNLAPLGLRDTRGLNASGQVIGPGPANSGEERLTGPNGIGVTQLPPELEFVYGVNADGTVVGQRFGGSFPGSAVVWRPGSDVVTLPGGQEARGINASHRIVGTSPGFPASAVTWTINANGPITASAATTLDPGEGSASALAINDAGRIVGERSTLATGFRAIYWDPIGNGYGTAAVVPGTETVRVSASAVASTGAVGGDGLCGLITCAFAWNGVTGGESSTVFLSALTHAQLAGVFRIDLAGINADGIAVGFTSGGGQGGFRWNTVTNEFAWLNDLVPGRQGNFVFVSGINDAGQIAASWRPFGGSIGQGVLLTPDTSNVVPEPSTYALLATGLVALGAVARRRRSR